MFKKSFIFIVILVSLSIGFVSVQYSYSQNYPLKPIEIVCILPAGSSMDILAREVAEVAPKYLGQPVVVINKPGAGGAIAATDVISSKPDGYKLITLSNISFSTVFKTQKIMFDPNHLTPVWNFIMFKIGMFVRGDSQWKTLDDLLNYARKNPGKVTWGHHIRGSSVHLAALLIFKKAGVKTIEIPHKGSAESMAALLGGHIDVLTTSLGTVIPHINSGKIRSLTAYGDQRFSDLPNVPCTTELGYPDVEKVSTYVGLYAHKDTPESPKKVLTEALKKTCEDPVFKKGIEKVGEDHRCGTPEFMKASIQKSEEVVVPLIKELGLYVEQK